MEKQNHKKKLKKIREEEKKWAKNRITIRPKNRQIKKKKNEKGIHTRKEN